MAMKRGYVPENSITLAELKVANKADTESITRIGSFLPVESAQKYLEASDKRLNEEHKDKVLIPEFGPEELVQLKGPPKEEQEFFGELAKLAGKTGAELEAMNPSFEMDYSEDIARVRWFLAQHWLHTLIECHADQNKSTPEGILCLREDLFPEESEADIAELGGSHMAYMRRDLGTAGIVYKEQQDACYAEFVENIKAYCTTNPNGLVLNSYENVRLFKEGDKYIVRQG